MPIRLHSRVVLPNGLHGEVIVVVPPLHNPLRELARVGVTTKLGGIGRNGHGEVALRDHESYVVQLNVKKKHNTIWPAVRVLREVTP